MAVNGTFLRIARELRDQDSGQDLIEYSLVGSLIGLACVVSIHALAVKIASALSGLATGLSSAY
jgi:Flp pilus assembly pilin Flp